MDGILQMDFTGLIFFLKGFKYKIVRDSLQEKLLGLMSLPTREQFEELKRKRKQEMEKKRILERQVSETQGCWRPLEPRGRPRLPSGRL